MRGKTYKKQRKKSSYITKGTGRVNQIRERRKLSSPSEKDILYRKVKRKVNLVNKRITNLKKGGYKGTWASKRLYERLDVGKLYNKRVLGRRGTLSISKELNSTQLNAISRASDLFLNSMTSTVSGIEKTRESVIESLRVSLGEDAKMLDREDAEFLYDLFNTTKFDDLAKYSGASTLWGHVEDYIENKTNEDELLDRLIKYGNLEYKNDLDIRDKTNDLVKKIIERKHPNLSDEEIDVMLEDLIKKI